MTTKEAMTLYEMVCREEADDYSPEEQVEIHKELEAIIASKSDRSAARLIQWWGCWDRNYTATAFCRRVRNVHEGLFQKS